MSDPKKADRRCWQCSSSSGGPERAHVICNFKIGGWGAPPITLPDWAWDAINGASREVHSTSAVECDGFYLRRELMKAAVAIDVPEPHFSLRSISASKAALETALSELPSSA